METKANYTIVGFFVLLVVAASAGFIYWMEAYGRQGPIAELVVRIPGSANGLSIGSAVRFNGIQVGTIKQLQIDPEDPRFTIARTQVKADTPVHSSTVAKLELSGLTGSGYIELTAAGQKGPNILQVALDNDTYAELTADRSSLANLLATADQIMKRLDDTVTQVQGVVDNISTPLTQTVSNVESFTKVLADNSDEIESFLSAAGDMSKTIKGVSETLNTALTSVNKLVEAVDADQVKSIVDNAETITTNVASASENIQKVVDQFDDTLATYQDFGEQAHTAFTQLNKIVSSVDPEKVSTSVDDFATVMDEAKAATASIRNIADNVNARSDDIDSAIANASQLTEKLNTASTRLNSVLTKVDDMLGSDDASSLTDQARKTLTAVQEVAETLNARIGPIMANIDSFSGAGLRDVTGLVNDTRRAVDNLNRTVDMINRDPQKLLFGGQSVKSYDGRNRY